MGKRTEFARDTIEVCRNCKAEGSVYGRTEDGRSHVREICPVCCGSGLVRKHIGGVRGGRATQQNHSKAMKRSAPAARINRLTTGNTAERVAKIAVKFLTWRQNLTKIHSCAYSTSATSPASITRRATLRNATNRCGGILCTLSIRCVTTRSSAIFGVGWRDSPTSPATHSPPYSTT